MASETIRRAIEDATVEVQRYGREVEPSEAAKRDWAEVADGLILPREIAARYGEADLYRETYEIAAVYASTLLASFN